MVKFISALFALPSVRYSVDRQLKLIYAGTALMGLFNLLMLSALEVEVLPYFYACFIIFFVFAAVKATIGNFARLFTLALLMIILQAVMSTHFIGDDCAITMYLVCTVLVSNYIHATPHSKTFRGCFILCATLAGLGAFLFIEDFFSQIFPPTMVIAPNAKIFFTVINACCSFALFIFICSIFALSFQGQLRELNAHNDDLRVAVNTDSMTGLLNRTGFYAGIGPFIETINQHRDGLCFVMLDIDFFKRINDSNGHEAGDMVLRFLGGRLLTFTKDFKLVTRWGGEEFLLTIEGAAGHAAKLMDQLREHIAAQSLTFYQHKISFTVSCGIARIQPHESVDECIRRADLALYTAKESGRNRVCVSPYRSNDLKTGTND